MCFFFFKGSAPPRVLPPSPPRPSSDLLQLARHETRKPPPVHIGARAILRRYGAVREQPRQGREKARQVVVTLREREDRKSTRLNSSHSQISYAVFCLKKKNNTMMNRRS